MILSLKGCQPRDVNKSNPKLSLKLSHSNQFFVIFVRNFLSAKPSPSLISQAHTTPMDPAGVYYSFHGSRKHLVIKDNSAPTWINAVQTCLPLKGLKGIEDINAYDFSSKLFLKYVPAHLIAEWANVHQHFFFLKVATTCDWTERWILAFHLK